jgi:hypothetical protein
MMHHLPIGQSDAEQLADRIVGSGTSVFGLIVLDERGNVLAGAPSSEVESFRLETGNELREFGKAVAVLHGVGSKASKYFGELRYLVYAFRERKVLVFHLHQFRVILAIVLDSTAPEARTLSEVARSVEAGRVGR